MSTHISDFVLIYHTQNFKSDTHKIYSLFNSPDECCVSYRQGNIFHFMAPYYRHERAYRIYTQFCTHHSNEKTMLISLFKTQFSTPTPVEMKIRIPHTPPSYKNIISISMFMVLVKILLGTYILKSTVPCIRHITIFYFVTLQDGVNYFGV